jgi:hypothetical protein
VTAGRRVRLLLVGAAVLGVIAGAGRPAAADEWTFRTGGHIDYYSADKKSGQGDGKQILAPFGLWYDAPRWGASVRGSYGTSQHQLDGQANAEITGFTDTTVGGYFRFRVAGTEIRLGLDLDLPTGVSRLKNSQLAAVQDQDLAALQRFGQGFDVNPTVTAYCSFGSWGLGVGLGYLWTGKYDPTQNVPNDDYDPGDQLTVAVLGDVILAEQVHVIGRFAYTHFTADEQGGQETFHQGDELDFTLGAEYRPEPWWVTASVREIYRFKAERLNQAGLLSDELQNNYGNELRGNVSVGYIFDDMWTVGGAVDVRYVAANDYASGDALHDGGRIKVGVGPWITWTFDRTLQIDASVRYFYLNAEESPLYPKGATFNGVTADVRLTYRF